MYYNTFYIPPPRPDELYHHGVLGMKWGIRKYQNKDGSLTSLGRNHYGYGDGQRGSSGVSRSSQLRARAAAGVSSARKTAYNIASPKKMAKRYQKYTESNMRTQAGIKDAEYARMKAEQHRRTMKKVAIGAGIAVAAVGAYTAYKYHAVNYTDRVIKAGESIQTLSVDKDRLLKGQSIYTNFLQGDKKIYEGWFGRAGIHGKYAMSAEATSDIKIASPAAGKKVFNDLMRNDAEFRNSYHQLKSVGSSAYKKGYDHFNSVILPRDVDLTRDKISQLAKQGKRIQNEQETLKIAEKSTELSKKFYDAMKSKGYGGVVDINDTKYSLLRGQAPTILFDKSKLGSQTVRQLTADDLRAGKAYADKVVPKIRRGQNIARGDYLKAAGYGSVIAASYVSTISYSNAKRSYSYKTAAQRRRELGNYYEKNPKSAPVKYRQTRSNSKIVSAYRKEHPNSKLTYYEILRMQESAK